MVPFFTQKLKQRDRRTVYEELLMTFFLNPWMYSSSNNSTYTELWKYDSKPLFIFVNCLHFCKFLWFCFTFKSPPHFSHCLLITFVTPPISGTNVTRKKQLLAQSHNFPLCLEPSVLELCDYNMLSEMFWIIFSNATSKHTDNQIDGQIKRRFQQLIYSGYKVQTC